MCLQIGGYTVPAGCMVTIPPFVIDNARWTYGEDAEEFNPSRWMPGGRHHPKGCRGCRVLRVTPHDASERRGTLWRCGENPGGQRRKSALTEP